MLSVVIPAYCEQETVPQAAKVIADNVPIMNIVRHQNRSVIRMKAFVSLVRLPNIGTQVCKSVRNVRQTHIVKTH